MTEPGLGRRAFLAALVGLGAGGGLFLLLRRTGPAGGAGEELRIALGAFPSDLDHARALGRAWLEAGGSADDEAALLASLFGEPGRDRPASGRALAARLRERVREDFARGRTVELRGWTLARSEAQLCGLLELLAQSGRLEARA